jgi:hypothetical protein
MLGFLDALQVGDGAHCQGDTFAAGASAPDAPVTAIAALAQATKGSGEIR